MNHCVKAVAAAVFAATLFASTTHAQQLTVGQWTSKNCLPFICSTGVHMNRYQQVYSSSAFTSGSMSISALTFYMSNYSSNVDGNTYTISLSTTSAAVNALSSNASANVGSNSSLFFSGVLSSPTHPSFTISGSAFLYDPSLGNLLLDLTVSGAHAPAFATYMDADATGTLTSRAIGSGNLVTGDQVGIVTTFDSVAPTTAPEPGSMLLVSTGLAGIAAIRRRRRS